MSFSIEQINQQFDTLQQAVADEQARVTKDIAALKAQVASGTAVTQAQLDALGAKMVAVTDSVANFDINTPAPPVVAPTPPIPTA